MKKALLLLLFLTFIVNTNAFEKDTITRDNEISLVLTDLLNGSYQFKYERVLNNHFSISTGLGIKGEEGLVSLSGIDTEKIQTNTITYSGIKIVPEVRYYLREYSEKQMRGFYFGAYIKHSRFQSDLIGVYTSDIYESFNINVDAKINITSVGLMVGHKLNLYKRFSLDFLIAGPGTAHHSYSLQSRTIIPDEFYDDLNEALKKYSLYDLINSDFDFKGSRKKTSFMIPTFRYALSISYSF